jgi:hypothetical protein
MTLDPGIATTVLEFVCGWTANEDGSFTNPRSGFTFFRLDEALTFALTEQALSI